MTRKFSGTHENVFWSIKSIKWDFFTKMCQNSQLKKNRQIEFLVINVLFYTILYHLIKMTFEPNPKAKF